MAVSLPDPRVCGHAKVAAYHVTRTSTVNVSKHQREGAAKFKGKICRQQHDDFIRIFEDRKSEFTIDYKQFVKNLSPLKDIFVKWAGKGQKQKEKYLETFSVKNWTKLSNAKKSEHTLKNCKGCYHNHPEVHSMFTT